MGWFFLVYLGLEGLVAFVFLGFAFRFGVGFASVCLFCFVLWLDVVVSVSVFLLFFLFFVCFSVGSGEVAQRATSLGPKPSLFFCSCFFFVFFVCFCLFCFFLLSFLGFK